MYKDDVWVNTVYVVCMLCLESVCQKISMGVIPFTKFNPLPSFLSYGIQCN